MTVDYFLAEALAAAPLYFNDSMTVCSQNETPLDKSPSHCRIYGTEQRCSSEGVRYDAPAD